MLRLLEAEGVDRSEVSVLICDDDEIHKLNRQFRGVDGATDVLAFPLGTDGPIGGRRRLLGDVAVSLETAVRQAELCGHDAETECVLLVLHGTLHLLGYDDRTQAEARKMISRAQMVARAMGYRFESEAGEP